MHPHCCGSRRFAGLANAHELTGMNVRRYALGPICIIVILLLPWLWVRTHMPRDSPVVHATFVQFTTLKLFSIFLVYPPVSRIVLSSLKCNDLGLDGSYLHADYRVDCDSNEYTWVRTAGIAFTILWPIGAPLYLGRPDVPLQGSQNSNDED